MCTHQRATRLQNNGQIELATADCCSQGLRRGQDVPGFDDRHQRGSDHQQAGLQGPGTCLKWRGCYLMVRLCIKAAESMLTALSSLTGTTLAR